MIYPPRPDITIPPNELNNYDKGHWLAQPKYNGSRNLIHIKNQEVTLWNRHNSFHKTFALNETLKQEILALPGLKKKEYILDSELLNKTKTSKNKIVLFDVLHVDKYLFMANQLDRLKMLNLICGSPTNFDKIGYQISNNLYLSPTYFDNFEKHFNEFTMDEIEGLVLRKKNSSLDNFGRKEYNCKWLVRCRRDHKNYPF